jgi:hypothetical protein
MSSKVLQPSRFLSGRACPWVAHAALGFQPARQRPPQPSVTQKALSPNLGETGRFLSGLVGDKELGAPRLGAQEQQSVWSTTAAERALAASLLGLGCIAIDVFSPSSLHLLAGLDTSAHQWVVEHVPQAMQRIPAGHVLSDAATTLGLLGWAGTMVYAAWAPAAGSGMGERCSQALLLAVAAYTAGGAFTEWREGDGMVVVFLKHLFHRARPSHEVHTSYSFPSGHTTGAVFIVGG